MPGKKDDGYEVLDITDKGKEVRGWLERLLGDMQRASKVKQLSFGAVSGWVTGYLGMKVGKLAATALGGSVLLLQIASHKGYIKVNWNKLNKDLENAGRQITSDASKHAPRVVDEVRDFARENVYIAGGFAGGLLLGVASS